MNITNNTDIFFISGQHWGAISTISNIILVGVLVWINWKYLKKLSKQTDLMEKDRERNKILEGIQQVLTPCIHYSKREIDKITNGTRLGFGQNRIGFGQKFNEFFDRKRYYCYAFEDIIDKVTDLTEKLHSNDKLAGELNTLYDEIEKEVTNEFKNDKFNERLTLMINNFNRLNSDALGTETRTLPVLETLCKEYIINQWDLSNNVPRVSEHENDFLKEYKDELQRYIELPRIKKLSKEIEDTLNRLKKSDEDILERFEEIIKEYRKDYHFTEDEIKPYIKQERDALNRILLNKRA